MNELSTIMTTDVIVVKRQTPISEVIEILLENNITGLPVVDDDMTLWKEQDGGDHCRAKKSSGTTSQIIRHYCCDSV